MPVRLWRRESLNIYIHIYISEYEGVWIYAYCREEHDIVMGGSQTHIEYIFAYCVVSYDFVFWMWYVDVDDEVVRVDDDTVLPCNDFVIAIIMNCQFGRNATHSTDSPH